MSEAAIPQLAGSQGLQKTYFLPVRSFLMDFYSAVAALLTGTIRSRFLDPIKDRETKEKVKQRWGGGNSPSWLAPHQLAVICGMPRWESFIENLKSFLQRKLSIQQSDTRDHQDSGTMGSLNWSQWYCTQDWEVLLNWNISSAGSTQSTEAWTGRLCVETLKPTDWWHRASATPPQPATEWALFFGVEAS